MRVDAWMQHPGPGFLDHEMFAPLLRWTGAEPPPDGLPLELTIAAMDEGGIDVGLLSAWYGPEGALVANDAVAAVAAAAPSGSPASPPSTSRSRSPRWRSSVAAWRTSASKRCA